MDADAGTGGGPTGPDTATGEGSTGQGDGTVEAGQRGPEGGPGTTAAFAAASNEVRLDVLRRLRRAEREGDPPLSFTELFEAADADTTAGFAYHLRQLTGHLVRGPGGGAAGSADADGEGDAPGSGQREAGDGGAGGYRLTAAGRRLARAVAAGSFAPAPSFDPVVLDDPCPHCGDPALSARCADGDVAVACAACGRPVLSLPAPPGGGAPCDVLSALDRHHRHRLAALADGVCPDCGGAAAATLVERDDGDLPGDGRRVQARLSCRGCGCDLRAPVTLCVLDHPAVAGFYRDHGTDFDDRPLWNVGDEWRETVLATDPWCVRVSTALGGDVLSLFVDGDLDVRAVRRPAS